MRLSRLSFVTIVAGLIASSGLADELNSMVAEEMRKIQAETRENYIKLDRRIEELNNQRPRVIAEYRKRAEAENQGMEILRKYSVVIANRYRDELTGKFEPGMEIAPKDNENLGRIMTRYFGANTMQGKISAGEAQRQIAAAMTRLTDMIRVHSEPSEGNNSELEILAFQIKDAQNKMRGYADLAKGLGMDLESAIAEAKKEARGLSSLPKPPGSR